MAGIDFKLDHAGVRQLLKSPKLAAAVNQTAQKIAANVEGQGQLVAHGDSLPVVVEPYTTDRAAASVTLAHPAGVAVQAKHGALTRAAAAVGLEVKAK